MAKVDAHVIQPEEFEEAPELSDADFDRAAFRVGGVQVDPKTWSAAQRAAKHEKATADLQLDADVLAHFKAKGPHWQAVVNAILRAAMEGRTDAPAKPA